MPPTACPACQGKWAIVSGGLCAVCRSLDRLAAYCRGPQLPPHTGEVLLTQVRTWIGEAQDLSETLRGVVPCPKGVAPKNEDPGEPPIAGAAAAPVEPEVAGATPKAGAPLPPPPPPEETPGVEETPEAGGGKAEPSSSHHSGRSHKEERASKTPKREKKKRTRKSRSRRRSRSRSRTRWASPVRPSGVRGDSSPERNVEALRRRKARPRSPSYSPARPPLPRHPPSRRPIGAQWAGPIRARPRELPPGQGRHFGKNKGVSKRKRNRDFWRGARRGRR